MNQADIRKMVLEWANEIGTRAAIVRLINAGISPDTAQKLASGRYQNTPKPLLESAIVKAMGEGDLAS